MDNYRITIENTIRAAIEKSIQRKLNDEVSIKEIKNEVNFNLLY